MVQCRLEFQHYPSKFPVSSHVIYLGAGSNVAPYIDFERVAPGRWTCAVFIS